MKERREDPRERIEKLAAAVNDLQDRIQERTISRLCRMLLEEKGETPSPPLPADRDLSPESHAREGGALLGLQLLRLQAELDLLTRQPEASWAPAVTCMGEIARLTVQAGPFFVSDRHSILAAGWFLLGCCRSEAQAQTLMRCMPLRYSLLLRQMGEAQEQTEQTLQNVLYTLSRVIFGCVEWDLPRAGAGVLTLLAPALAEPLGADGTAAFYNEILLQSGDMGGSALVAAYGDGVTPADLERWRPDTRGDFYWGYGFALHKTGRQEDAMAAFDRCWTLRRQSLGPDHVLTLLPRAFSWFVRLVVRCREYDGEGAAFLVGFLERVLEHRYDAEIAYERLILLAGGLTFATLGRLARMGKGDLTDRLMQLYADNCIRYDGDPAQPGFRKRYALGLAGVRESMRNNGNQALEYTLRALETPILEQDADALMNEATLEYNAGYLCCLMGDFPEGTLRLAKLIDRMTEAQDTWDEEIYLRAVATYYSCRLLTDELEEEEAEDLRQLLRQGARAVCGEQRPFATEADKLEMIAYSSVLELLYSSGNLPPEELPVYTRMVRTGLRRMEQNTLLAALRTMLTYQLMLLLWLQDDPESLAMTDSCARQIRETPLQDRIRASCSLLITLIRNRYCGPQDAAPYARTQLQELEKQWKNSVRTLDDVTLSLSMFNARIVFGSAYGILRGLITTEQAFELVLRFKALASLAARERNRILLELRDESARKDLAELHRLQNQRTVLYTLPDPDEEQLAQIERQLARLSARVEAAMPDIGRFTVLSLQALGEKLPEGSAVLEYYWPAQVTRRTFLGQAEQENSAGLDVYVLRRQDGKMRLERRTLCETGTSDLLGDCEEFRRCCGNGDTYADRAARARKNALRCRLYRALIQPVEDLLTGVHTLYIAPEELLRDIPYGLLGPAETCTLEDRCTVVEMICSRDLLFDGAAADQGGACVVGDPDYGAHSRAPEQEEERGTDRGLTRTLYPLPFSRTEAELVARYTAGRCLVGRQATKQAVLAQAGAYGILHIAAHGDFDDEEDAGLFRARIYLAGAQTFLDTEQDDPRYGNGFLTANEISRMDLHGTWLAVLSACFSGMGEGNAAGSIQGLVSAFGAAGVRYVVASLWEADDFATAELMRRFYRELSAGRPAPDALRLAKRELARATVGELRQAGWEALRRSPDTPQAMRDVLDLRLERADTFRPFADESYWGGFVCHRCR